MTTSLDKKLILPQKLILPYQVKLSRKRTFHHFIPQEQLRNLYKHIWWQVSIANTKREVQREFLNAQTSQFLL